MTNASSDYGIEKRPGGFWRRLTAGVIDFLLCLALYILLYTGVVKLLDYLESDLMFDIFWQVIPGFFIFLFLFTLIMEIAPLRATVGKVILGIRVYDLQGNRAGMVQILLRHLAKLLTLLTAGVGFIMVAFQKDRRTLHDLLTGCSVLRLKKTNPDDQQSSPV